MIKKLHSSKILPLCSIFAAIILSVVGFYLYRINDTAPSADLGKPTLENSKSDVNTEGSQKNPNSVQNQTENTKQLNKTPTNTTVLDPQGNFVSNHNPISAFQSIESVCTTNPTATCEISFKNDDTIIRLDKKVVGASGNATWVWTPSSIGLSSGTWEVTATAELNGTSNSTTDPTELVIAP